MRTRLKCVVVAGSLVALLWTPALFAAGSQSEQFTFEHFWQTIVDLLMPADEGAGSEASAQEGPPAQTEAGPNVIFIG